MIVITTLLVITILAILIILPIRAMLYGSGQSREDHDRDNGSVPPYYF